LRTPLVNILELHLRQDFILTKPAAASLTAIIPSPLAEDRMEAKENPPTFNPPPQMGEERIGGKPNRILTPIISEKT
jgi:hypothetical protein